MVISRKKEHLLFLDGARGLAALYVLIGHARWLLWEGFADGYLKHPEQYPFFSKVLALGFFEKRQFLWYDCIGCPVYSSSGQFRHC
jgi:hypothetical protein